MFKGMHNLLKYAILYIVVSIALIFRGPKFSRIAIREFIRGLIFEVGGQSGKKFCGLGQNRDNREI